MDWFSKLKQAFLPQNTQTESQEVQTLEETTKSDRNMLTNVTASTPKVPESTLSPFASRILEKAKIESLKEDEDREKITAPAELFLSREDAKKRVEHIESIVLQKSKNATKTLTDTAKAMPDITFNAFAKKENSAEK